MALIKLGGGITDIRGSMGGNTFSRNKAGNYLRSNKKPVNPRSPLQVVVRNTQAFLAKYWSATLTAQQRIDWRAYAAGTQWTNKLGETIEIGGNAAFMQLNALRFAGGLTIHPAAPTAMGHAGGVGFTFAAETDTPALAIADPTQGWDKDTDDHELFIFSGLPTEAGRDATPKGFRFCETLSGDSSTPLTFPYDVTPPYTMAIGQNITIRAMFQDENFRVSGPYWVTDVAALA
jgi:hypothetical protein|tara:strand:+ start:427 stop:1125 length:699 start_codon:yes stop_codon:yes gene_type:complete